MTYHISVIICAYTEERWDDLVAAVESVKEQTLQASEIIIVIDHNPSLLKRAREQLQNVVLVENTESAGLRGARNSGIAVAQGQIIAFLDDDAVAIHDWLRLLVEGYGDSHVLGTGGAVTPMWIDRKPTWLPEEFYWVIGCSYRGLPQVETAVRNPIGANMSIRREVFDLVGDFHSEVVKIGKQHAGGCEETELFIRVQQHLQESIFLYTPQANVFHRVPSSRTTLHYFCSRCYVEGLAKAVMSQYVGTRDGLASEWNYTLRTLPTGILRGLTDTLFHRDLGGLVRVTAILIGLTATTAGYLIGRLFLRITKPKKDIPERCSLQLSSNKQISLNPAAEELILDEPHDLSLLSGVTMLRQNNKYKP